MAGHLERLTGPEAATALAGDPIVVVPIGAIEQHGPHLPLDVDYVIADEVARAVVARCGDELPVWSLPALPYSKSNEHAWSAGTIWFSVDTMLAMLNDIARCVAAAGARRLVFLNGHGGNSTLLNVACREIRLQHGLLTFLVHAFAPPAYSPPPPPDQVDAATEHGMGIHGGHDETSVMMYLRPESVYLDRASRNVPEWLVKNDHVKFGGTAQFGWLSDDFGPDGHIGDPTAATADHGRKLFDASVELLMAQLREIAVFEFGGR